MSKTPALFTSLALALGLGAAACKDTGRDEPAGKTVEPAGDNTGVNERDRADHERTADQADLDQSSVDTMAKIRRSILDGDFSTNADNVKIIVSNGIVTLKGPVGSVDEKAAVEAKAAEIAGKANVVSELTVTP